MNNQDPFDQDDDPIIPEEKKPVKENPQILLLKILQQDPDFKVLYRWNEFSHDVEHTRKVSWSNYIYEGKPLTDNDVIEFMGYLAQSKYKLVTHIKNHFNCIKAIALKYPYHPIKSWLDSLVWDGTPRLQFWLGFCCNVELNKYTEAVAKKMLVAAVARIYQPGIKYDEMVILEGQQGIKKSTLLEILAGKKYHTTINFNMTTKDIVDIMRGKWIIEVKEMRGFARAERDKIKTMLDQSTDRVRLSYGYIAEDFLRNSIFIGTMNPSGDNRYFEDETGNRRFWPVECHGEIDTDYLVSVREQLWAEAVFNYKSGERLFMDTPELESLAKERQKERLSIDPWGDIIHEYLNGDSGKVHIPSVKVNMKQITDEALKLLPKDLNRGVAGRLGRIIKSCGWHRERYDSEKMRADYGCYYIPLPETIERHKKKDIWIDEKEEIPNA